MSEVKLDLVEVAGPRRRRSAQERVQIVEESFLHGMSVARVARKYGINANQVFQWRRMQQSEIYSREGVDLDRSTLAGWVGKALDVRSR